MKQLVYVVISENRNDTRVESVHNTKAGAQAACNKLHASGQSTTWYAREVQE